MNILYLSDVSFDVIGGAQESMKIIIDGLNDEYNFMVITPGNKKRSTYNIIELHQYENFTLKKKNIFDIVSLVWNIQKVIQSKNIDLIHVQMPSTMLIVGLIKKIGLINKNIMVIYTDRGVYDKYGKLTQMGIKYFASVFSKIILTTDNNRCFYTDVLDINQNKLAVIPNTAGPMFEDFDENQVAYNRNKYNISLDEIVIMFAGRMSKDKNWTLALKIIKQLKEVKNIKFIIALGSNCTEESINKCNQFIKEIQNEINKESLLYFIDLPIEEMSKLYYCADIFILTSSVESFGRTAIEAMSRKVVVYGTDVDGLKEVISYRENIYNNEKDLCPIILELIDNREKLIIEKEKFYRRFKDNFSLKNNIDGYKKIYLEIEEEIKF